MPVEQLSRQLNCSRKWPLVPGYAMYLESILTPKHDTFLDLENPIELYELVGKANRDLCCRSTRQRASLSKCEISGRKQFQLAEGRQSAVRRVSRTPLEEDGTHPSNA